MDLEIARPRALLAGISPRSAERHEGPIPKVCRDDLGDIIAVWAWTQPEQQGQKYLAANEDPTNSDLGWTCFTSVSAARAEVPTRGKTRLVLD